MSATEIFPKTTGPTPLFILSHDHATRFFHYFGPLFPVIYLRLRGYVMAKLAVSHGHCSPSAISILSCKAVMCLWFQINGWHISSTSDRCPLQRCTERLIFMVGPSWFILHVLVPVGRSFVGRWSILIQWLLVFRYEKLRRIYLFWHSEDRWSFDQR